MGRLDRIGSTDTSPTPEGYVDRLRQVFVQLHRVVGDTGTVWLNLGDSYSAGQPDTPPATNCPRKSLLGMPWRVAFALQRDGWILRNAIVWHKPNAMPESVRDRMTNRYEMLFLLTKQQKYFFNLDAIREPLKRPEALGERIVVGGANKGRHAGLAATARRRGHSVYGEPAAPRPPVSGQPGKGRHPTRPQHVAADPRGKNPGDVWTIATRPLHEAHFAAFPIDIPLRCIAAGCPTDGTVLDPFSGAATTGLAATRLGRSYIGIDLNPTFHDIGLRRLGCTAPRAAA